MLKVTDNPTLLLLHPSTVCDLISNKFKIYFSDWELIVHLRPVLRKGGAEGPWPRISNSPIKRGLTIRDCFSNSSPYSTKRFFKNSLNFFLSPPDKKCYWNLSFARRVSGLPTQIGPGSLASLIRSWCLYSKVTGDAFISDYSYNGKHNASIKKIEEFVANVVCEFKLELFPFDVNVCTLTVNIQNRGFSKTRFNVRHKIF